MSLDWAITPQKILKTFIMQKMKKAQLTTV